jgi:hypothetical protein
LGPLQGKKEKKGETSIEDTQNKNIKLKKDSCIIETSLIIITQLMI